MITPAEFWSRFGSRIVVDEVTGCWMFQRVQRSTGYGRAWVNGHEVRLHRLSLEVHRPGELTDEKPWALHACPGGGRRACCNPEHLKAGTAAENNADRDNDGRTISGERQWKTRLTASLVREIRRRCAAGEAQLAVARALGVGHATVNHVIQGRTWTHVEAESVA